MTTINITPAITAHVSYETAAYLARCEAAEARCNHLEEAVIAAHMAYAVAECSDSATEEEQERLWRAYMATENELAEALAEAAELYNNM